MVILLTGLCLFLSKTKLDLDSYNCETFDYGCPDKPYAAETIFECMYSKYTTHQF